MRDGTSAAKDARITNARTKKSDDERTRKSVGAEDAEERTTYYDIRWVIANLLLSKMKQSTV